MTEYKGVEYLRSKLVTHRSGVLRRYEYYNQKNNVQFISKLLPQEYRWLQSSQALGWCGKAVDSIADHLSVYQFKNDNFDMNGIYKLNNADILFNSAILGALISACDFIYISADQEGFPRLQVIDGSNATGIVDPITNMLVEGYAVLERDTDKNPTLEAYFVAGRTDYYPKGGVPYSVENVAPAPLLVPIIYRPDADRPLGHARITHSCMDLTQKACRTMMRTEIAEEFYSFPQKYISGLSEDAEFNNRIANYSNFLALFKDADGDKPTVGQFQSGSMTPNIDSLKTWAAQFSGETNLTLDDLGFVSGNPQSAEAINASHEQLRLAVVKAQKNFAIGFLNAGYLAACVRDNQTYKRNEVYQTELLWEPIFTPNANNIAQIADAITKIETVRPNYISDEAMRILLGF